jgi:hypothetical protein
MPAPQGTAADMGRQRFPAAFATEARDWLADCDCPDAYALSTRAALAAIRRHFDGGLPSFALGVWC